MILQPRVAARRALTAPRAHRTLPSRKASVRVNALFGRKAPSFGGGGNEEAALELLDKAKKFNAPSEAGNQAVSQAV
jgi:hypothetical protein